LRFYSSRVQYHLNEIEKNRLTGWAYYLSGIVRLIEEQSMTGTPLPRAPPDDHDHDRGLASHSSSPGDPWTLDSPGVDDLGVPQVSGWNNNIPLSKVVTKRKGIG
jgi:hypothetical protein